MSLETAITRVSEIIVAWQLHWKPLKIDAHLPREMRTWLAHHVSLVQSAAALRKRNQVEELGKKLAENYNALQQCLARAGRKRIEPTEEQVKALAKELGRKSLHGAQQARRAFRSKE